jgi:hypothetical protein
MFIDLMKKKYRDSNPANRLNEELIKQFYFENQIQRSRRI